MKGGGPGRGEGGFSQSLPFFFPESYIPTPQGIHPIPPTHLTPLFPLSILHPKHSLSLPLPQCLSFPHPPRPDPSPTTAQTSQTSLPQLLHPNSSSAVRASITGISTISESVPPIHISASAGLFLLIFTANNDGDDDEEWRMESQSWHVGVDARVGLGGDEEEELGRDQKVWREGWDCECGCGCGCECGCGCGCGRG